MSTELTWKAGEALKRLLEECKKGQVHTNVTVDNRIDIALAMDNAERALKNNLAEMVRILK